VHTETKIALDCPYCYESIYETLDWFKKSYFTCPACGKGLAAGQFAAVIEDLEQSMEESIEEMLYGQPHGGCCGKKSSCGS
jgi:hypothetical protein